VEKARNLPETKPPASTICALNVETRISRGNPPKPWRLRCLRSLAAAAVSDDREGEKKPNRSDRYKREIIKRGEKLFTGGRGGRIGTPLPCPAISELIRSIRCPPSRFGLWRIGVGPADAKKNARPVRAGRKTPGAELYRHLLAGGPIVSSSPSEKQGDSWPCRGRNETGDGRKRELSPLSRPRVVIPGHAKDPREGTDIRRPRGSLSHQGGIAMAVARTESVLESRDHRPPEPLQRKSRGL
jgi:hypothetical protein